MRDMPRTPCPAYDAATMPHATTTTAPLYTLKELVLQALIGRPFAPDCYAAAFLILAIFLSAAFLSFCAAV